MCLIFVPLPYCFHCCSFVEETGEYASSSSIFLSQDSFGCLRYFLFLNKFKKENGSLFLFPIMEQDQGKKENPRWELHICKLCLNICVGESRERLPRADKMLEQFTGQTPVFSKDTLILHQILQHQEKWKDCHLLHSSWGQSRRNPGESSKGARIRVKKK